MPVYNYTCKKCGAEFDRTLKLADSDSPQKCKFCDGETKKNITLNAVFDDHPSWLDDPVLQENLQGANKKPILSRKEFKTHLRAKGLAQGE